MATPIPVIFIHGLWLHAASWEPWVKLFGEAGYAPLAPGWPGDPDTVEESRANPESIADHGIEDVTEHYVKIINGLAVKPILVGHAFGGMIAQRLLGQDLAAAAVAIDAAQTRGVPLPLPALRSAFPVFKNPGAKHKAVSLTAEQFRHAFGNAISEEESRELYERWAIPAPGKPLFEAAAADFDPQAPAEAAAVPEMRGPLLLITGGRDHTVPELTTRATLRRYRHPHAVTDIKNFPDRAHSLTIDGGWRMVADIALSWLRAQEF
jgi:pimeloyl-ACP methyl ester carboxylesterase